MTASIQNTLSAIEVLEKALEGYETQHGAPRHELLTYHFQIRILLNSVRKCFESLAAQIRFYQSAKGTGRSLIVEDTNEVINGQLVHALCVPLPGQSEDAVIYGKPAALKAVADALKANDQPFAGPSPIHDLARQLADTASPPDTEKEKEHVGSTA